MIELALLVAVPIVAFLATRVAHRRRVDRAMSAIAGLRRMLGEAPALYGRPGPADVGLLASLEHAAGEERELRLLGFEHLGDTVWVIAIPGMRTVARVMASADRTASAHVMVTGTITSVCFVSASAASDEVWTTRSRSPQQLAYGPHVDSVTRPLTTPFAELLAQHRARTASLTDTIAFRDLDDVLRNHAASRARTVAWRTAMDPDALIEADVRGMLGARFDRHGPRLMAELRAPVPRAVVLPKR